VSEHVKGWLWRVEFARGTSPDNTDLTVYVVAPNAVEADASAQIAVEEKRRGEVRNLSVRVITRLYPVHRVNPAAGSKP